MDFSENWKSFFPVSISPSSPILIPSSARPTLGPLIFNPIPETLTHVFSSSSLLPPPLHIPQLSLSRLLITSCPDAPVLPSTASSIASHCGPQFQNDIASILQCNRLEFLKYGNSVIVFFPTGVNSEKVGFLILHVEGSSLHLQLDGNGDIFRATSGESYSISRILVNPIDDEEDDLGESSSTIGYLLAFTCYSAHWFSVQYNSSFERPSVVYMGGKIFKTCSVVHACWSPHTLEESLVLLESGELFLFDLEYYMKDSSSNGNFRGTRLRVPWHDSNCSDDKVWLSCEFSWHPRIFIVARSDVVFLVDLSADKCVVSCLLKVEVLHMHTPTQSERFLALSRASPDGFYFAVASNAFLLLCDVRKHMMPIIRWAHGLDRPCFMNVLNLSMLRSHSREDTFKSASEVGFCIILGSFWHGMFNLFFYGPSLPSQRGSLASKLSKTSKTFYAWELPHEIVLSGRDCLCGSCLLKEELSKAALPEWIDWQMKKEMVLGFGIMNNDLASLLCEPYKYGGFTLVRLMSSGKLELQRYEASWVHDRKLEDCHEQGLRLDKYLLFTVGDEKYKYRKSVVFHKLNFINAYRRGNLTEFLVKKLKDPCMDDQEMGPFDVDVHEFLCEKLNACGVGPFRSSPAIIAFFKDVKPSANLHDVALRRLWAELPLDLLQLAFSKHSESLDVAIDQKKTTLEFLAVPSCPELPPFFLRKSSSCSNKGSNKAQRDGDIMGPILPLPILLVLHEIYDGCSDLEDGKFSVEAEVDIKYNEIMKVAAAISVSISGSESSGNYEVSLADDANETWVDPSKLKPFLLYRPAALNCSGTNLVYENSIYRGKIHDTLIFHVLEEKTVSNDKSESELVGPEIFDDLCLVDLRFNAPSKKFEGGGLKAFDVLKRQLSKWQEGVDSYKELTVQSGFLKPVSK
ncbi:uncharacterized protein LOC114726630 isoform X1 [Neltuma alba]|uniref:uncharacterized protein LOC114726630 isoform X1 n=1 Tax=Neltuma alba TaxID=207710 RepID=UPI0010A2E040|nr:uncharacterized protein LOC114726630 isoform X1 [Prosopis alba]XP_028769111.1 uncharacterized protein LOC114726630 isoform X1 [Prosopis alba]